MASVSGIRLLGPGRDSPVPNPCMPLYPIRPGRGSRRPLERRALESHPAQGLNPDHTPTAPQPVRSNGMAALLVGDFS